MFYYWGLFEMNDGQISAGVTSSNSITEVQYILFSWCWYCQRLTVICIEMLEIIQQLRTAWDLVVMHCQRFLYLLGHNIPKDSSAVFRTTSHGPGIDRYYPRDPGMIETIQLFWYFLRFFFCSNTTWYYSAVTVVISPNCTGKVYVTSPTLTSNSWQNSSVSDFKKIPIPPETSWTSIRMSKKMFWHTFYIFFSKILPLRHPASPPTQGQDKSCWAVARSLERHCLGFH